MIDVNSIIATELSIKEWQVENALALKNEGATIPFIARYRKERTGELDENVIRDMFDRYEYLLELEDRKQTVLKSIEEQGKLTDELKAKIEACLLKTELEDLYLPYKPKKRTRATIAKEKGLEPLALQIKELNVANAPEADLNALAAAFVNAEKEVANEAEALKGASDIIAEEIAETAETRAWIREYIAGHGMFASTIKEEFPVGSTKFEMYREFEMPAKEIKPHIMLALRRGETEGILNLDLKFDEEAVLNYIEKKNIFSDRDNMIAFLKNTVKDAFARLMKFSLIGEVRLQKKVSADEASITVFEANMRQLLLASPAGMKPTLGVDPGFRTGCKIAVIDETGKFTQYKTIHPFQSNREKEEARNAIKELIAKHNIELVAIGNGTASRETDEFIDEVYKEIDKKPIKVIVSEAGASVYSASKLANEEFPELDLTIRGAISIARRLQDPLAELVKIDPKSIGVGQYQHDVDQKLLKKKLDETVDSCVNYVGVDLNTASKELLTHVSGINEQVAKAIVEWRNENGAFKNRKELMKVPRFGDKKFEQAAGFLRIRGGENPLDNSAVHPESYKIAEKIANSLEMKFDEIAKNPEKLKSLDLNQFVDDKVGLPTLKDIVAELLKPGRDPREEFKYATFEGGVKEIKDLRIGMELEGVVTNITNFGAFVDIGVHQDGLVHVSELADRFVSNPIEVVHVGQIVKVKVIEVNEGLKRINLSMKKGVGNKKAGKKIEKEPTATLDDLKSKFAKR
jgi:uncharacterized protein